MRRYILAASLALAAAAQDPPVPPVAPISAIQVQTGALRCGIVRRAVNRVQTYCYAPDPAAPTTLILVQNSIMRLEPATVSNFEWKPPNYIVWEIKTDGTTITFTVILDFKVKMGTLTADLP